MINKGCLCLLASVLSFNLFAESKPVAIKEAIDIAFEKSSELKELFFHQQDALSEELKLKGEMRPKIEIMAGLAPYYGVTGDALNSVKDTNEWGLARVSKIEMSAPIYAFGRGENYLKAIGGMQEKVAADVLLKKNDIAYKVKELYFGNVLALNLIEFANNSITDLETALEKIDKKKTPDDYSRINILLQQVTQKKLELDKLKTLTSMGLNIYLSGKREESYIPKDEYIDRPEYAEEPLAYYIDLAMKTRPELKQLQVGIRSKTEQMTGDKKGYLPAFAVLAKYDYANAPSVTDQKSIFANDNYNKSDVVMAVGLVWKLDFGITQGKIDKSQAELNSFKAKNEYATLGIEMEVTQAFYDYQEKLEKIELSSKAFKEGQKWLRRVSSSVSLGLVNAKEIVDAYQAHATTLGQYYQALYDAHISYAKLTLKCGLVL